MSAALPPPHGVLGRLDLAITANRSGTENTQVPVPGAIVELFGQGATVATAVVVPASGSVSLNVRDIGQLTIGATVQLGVAGPPLTVSDVTVPPDIPAVTRVTLSNSSSVAVTVPSGGRLLLTSLRPIAYSDPTGVTSLGSRITADASGLVGVYVSQPRFDYVVLNESCSTSTATATSASSMSWSHYVSGDKPALLVAISWTGPGDSTVSSVTCAGVAMTLAAADTNLALFTLVGPPIGYQTIVVNFYGGSMTSAACGAISYPRVDLMAPLSPAVMAGGTSNAPAVDVSAVSILNPSVAFLSVWNLASLISATPGSSQSQRWSVVAGVYPPTRITMQSCTTTLAVAGTVHNSWTLGQSQSWLAAGVEVRLLPIRIVADAVATAEATPSWFNAQSFASIQHAIDALPAGGGTVYIPASVYHLTATLYTPCDRPCHLIGDGCSDNDAGTTVLSFQTPTGSTTAIGMLRLRGNFSSVRGIRFVNTSGIAATSEDQGYGIMLGRRDVVDAHPAPGTSATSEYVKAGRIPAGQFQIEDVFIQSAAGWGLYIPGYRLTSGGQPEPNSVAEGAGEGGTITIEVDIKRVRVKSSLKYGACFTGGGCTLLRFESCAFIAQGAGQNGSAAGSYYVYVSSTVQAVFEQCTFEGKSPTTLEWVVVSAAEDTQFDTCWFEDDGGAAYTPTYFIRMRPTCRGGGILNCHFVRDSDNGGLMKLIQLDAGTSIAPGVSGLTICNPYAISAKPTLDTSNPNLPVFHDPNQIDLGGDTNSDLVVVGSGILWDQGVPGDPERRAYAIQYSNVPRLCIMSGAVLAKAPRLSDPELLTNSAGSVDRALVARQDGNVLLNSSLAATGPVAPALMVRATPGYGAGASWQLANNAPSMSTSDRDARANWQQGDIIYNTSALRLEVRIGSAWKGITLVT